MLAGCLGIASFGRASSLAQAPGHPKAEIPPMPSGIVLNNPFQSFRELLSATPAERELILEKKQAIHRTHLEERLKEFGSLPAAEREIRLRMMELRWFLVPLFKMSPPNRVERLAFVPEGARKLVEDRLREWDDLPAHLRQDVLQHGITLQYFARLEAVAPRDQVKLWNSMGAESRPQPAMSPDQWKTLMSDRKKSVSVQLERFFDLSSEEKLRVLQGFSEGQREHVGTRLKKLEQLPAAERKQCLDSFQKYSELSEKARIEFLKNAEQWKAMSAEERKAWRSLITSLPPKPPGLEADSRSSLAEKLIAGDAPR